MHPVLIKPFGFAIYSYSAMLLLAFIFGIGLAVWIAKRRGPTDPSAVQDVGVLGIIWGLIGGRLGWILWEFDYYSTNPDQILNLRAGGMTILGGIVMPFIALTIYYKYKGVQPLNVLDTYAAPLLLGMAIGRLGCVLHGCCQGNVCDPGFALALTYPEGTFGVGEPAGPRYPSQLFETFADLLLMGFIIWLIPRIKFAGQGIYTMLLGYGIIRFLNEFTRGDIKYIGPITLAQWVAIGMSVVGLLGLLGVFGRPAVDNSWQKGFPKDKEE
ncbi:MAG: prolipoprotein diacylglyceryl transferase [Vulcanimicrobiota bacterium]